MAAHEYRVSFGGKESFLEFRPWWWPHDPIMTLKTTEFYA